MTTLEKGVTAPAAPIPTTAILEALASADRLTVDQIRERTRAVSWPESGLQDVLDSLRDRRLLAYVDVHTYALTDAGREFLQEAARAAEQAATIETRDVSPIQEAFEEWAVATLPDLSIDEFPFRKVLRYRDAQTHGLWLAFLAGFDASGKVGGFAGEESRG